MILRLAHVVISAADLDEAEAFYGGLLGFVEHERQSDQLYMRAAEEFDCWSLGIAKRGGPGLVHTAFRVSEPDDLDRLEKLHEKLGIRSERVSAGAEPGQGPSLRLTTPDGHAIEFVHEIDEIDPHDADGALRLPMRQ